MIFDYLKINGWTDQKAYYYGHTRSFSQLGSAISSLVGGFMVFYTGSYREIFLYTAIPYILDLMLVASYPRSLDGMRPQTGRPQVIDNFKQVTKGFIDSFIRITTLRVVANLSLHTGFFQAIKDYLQPVLQTLALSLPVMLMFGEKQRTAVIVGIVYFVIYLLTSFSSRKSGVFSSHFSSLQRPLNLTLAIGLVSGVLCGLFYISGLVVGAVITFVFIFMLENLRRPIGVSTVADITNKDYLATILSAESQSHSLLTALLAPAIGYLADTAGLGWSLFLVSGFLLLLSPLIYLRRS
jgi:hypothetical protein